jgi:hypothetical protein
MSEAEIKSARQEIRQLKEMLDGSRALERALRDAARNIAVERDGWKACALRMRSDCAHVE